MQANHCSDMKYLVTSDKVLKNNHIVFFFVDGCSTCCYKIEDLFEAVLFM